MKKLIHPTTPPVNHFIRDDGTEEYNTRLPRCRVRIQFTDGKLTEVRLDVNQTNGIVQNILLNDTKPLEDMGRVLLAIGKAMGMYLEDVGQT